MAVQGERIAGGFIVITGIDTALGMPCGSRPSQWFTMQTSAGMKRWCSSTVGMWCVCRARWTKCWLGLLREGQRARCGALLRRPGL